jgi:hypothetical protein
VHTHIHTHTHTQTNTQTHTHHAHTPHCVVCACIVTASSPELSEAWKRIKVRPTTHVPLFSGLAGASFLVRACVCVRVYMCVCVRPTTVMSNIKDNKNLNNVRIYSDALVAQWIEHQTSNLGVAGSSPARGIYFGYECVFSACTSLVWQQPV